ncbi:MAG: Hpt domain-containing protein [Candidatus Omnitrophica bacterium]|nr:Hpt domain-containing protein [Candidatus Omnitrophota bacterium]
MGNITIDFEKNCQSLSISLNIYLRIMNKAVEQTHNDFLELNAALKESDYEKMRYVSHRLKGDYDNLRITEIAAMAKEINDIAKTNQDKDKIEDLFLIIKIKFSEVEKIIFEKTK